MREAIVLMSAVVPTTGHGDLIHFAANLPGVHHVQVLIGWRANEPVRAQDRITALKQHVANTGVTVRFVTFCEDEAPEKTDGNLDEFWNWWGNQMRSLFPPVPRWDDTYVVISEPWGQELADSMGAIFVPYDVRRILNPVKGTPVRNNLWDEWEGVLPEFRHNLNLTITLFGQESVGKTTIGEALGKLGGFRFVPEWAREYLETVGETLTEEKMRTIEAGQGGLQNTVKKAAGTPVSVQDTDLYSTLGYYRISPHTPTDRLLGDAWAGRSDMYYVLPDDLPFTPDLLRYGGGSRETTTQFWVDLLEEFHLPYVLVPSGSVKEKTEFIQEHAKTMFDTKNEQLGSVVRAYAEYDESDN